VALCSVLEKYAVLKKSTVFSLFDLREFKIFKKNQLEKIKKRSHELAQIFTKSIRENSC